MNLWKRLKVLWDLSAIPSVEQVVELYTKPIMTVSSEPLIPVSVKDWQEAQIIPYKPRNPIKEFVGKESAVINTKND